MENRCTVHWWCASRGRRMLGEKWPKFTLSGSHWVSQRKPPCLAKVEPSRKLAELHAGHGRVHFHGLATFLTRRHVLPPSATRKVIHIGVAHWWLIAMATMSDPWVASVGPFSFIAINALALRLRLLPAMDEGSDRRNLGTIYFPITLLVLVNLCWRGVMPIWVGGIAALVLGWGDGLASLVEEGSGAPGVRIWGDAWGGRKSAAGSIVMFAASFAVTLVFTLIFNTRHAGLAPALGVSAVIAAAATAVELFTPLGLDNLTVPLAVAGLYAGIFL